MTSALIEFLVKSRDAHQMLADAHNDYLQTLAPTEVKSKIVAEETFVNLKYDSQTSDKLGSFETADPKENDAERFALAFSILKANESTISKRYHGPSYVNSYWTFNDKIYRQLLKK
jgi:hypothetical protein